MKRNAKKTLSGKEAVAKLVLAPTTSTREVDGAAQTTQISTEDLTLSLESADVAESSQDLNEEKDDELHSSDDDEMVSFFFILDSVDAFAIFFVDFFSVYEEEQENFRNFEPKMWFC